jgi:hypothetical protein
MNDQGRDAEELGGGGHRADLGVERLRPPKDQAGCGVPEGGEQG